MIKLNAFTTHIHAQYDFLKGAPIERLIKDIKKEDLADHGSLVGNAKSTFNSSKSYFLDRHNSVKHRVEEKLFYPKLEITNSWCNVQGEHSKLNFHKHPESLISGIIFLQVDENSSKLHFKNPNNIYFKCEDDICITPEPGLLLMWPSWLIHGSGNDKNMSTERIVVSFNTFFRKETNA